MLVKTIRRKQYFVEKALQLRFARVVILFVFVSSILSGLTIFYTTFILLGEKLASVYPQGRLAEISRSVYVALFVDMLIIIPVIFYGSIIFSHRIAGPLPKVYRALKEIGNGNFEVNLILRKHDELKELANTINAMAKSLKERQK